MNRYALRTRIVALAVLLVAFAVTAVGAATYVSLHRYAITRLDQQVQSVGQNASRAICAPPNGAGQQTADRTVYAAFIYGPDAQVVSVSCGDGYRLAKSLAVSGTDAKRFAGVKAASDPISLRTTDGREYRVIAYPSTGLLPDGSTTAGTAVLGLSTSDISDTLGRLVFLEVIIGAIAVLATAVLGTIGVRLEMRPLARVTRTARTVAAELGPDGRGLENRVPAGDPRTEVGQLAEAVNTMLGAVEQEYTARYESEQRMRRFLADASHELRTPLTSLRGYAELVRMRGGLDEDASDSLRRIETEGKRMGRLVDDLLTLARSDRGTVVERVEVDAAEVVDDAVAGIRAAYPQRLVEMTAREPLPVLGDRNQLQQVITNILSNAAVHATAPVPIRVTAQREGPGVVIRVADGGPGLPPEQAAQVFDRFWRADSARTRVRGGSGLGLSIVQALVVDHGGEVRFESDVASGTTVTVFLPAAQVPAPSDEAAFARPVPTSS
ncbi:MAG TPA: HAMP domain-containing sensor histidine kinase [Mycobacteriales bacterium]|nr:HAMP domain-containing sensor histidine kinase [Mycobacteriales bacterium]